MSADNRTETRLLALSNVAVRYGNGALGISDVSLSVDAGKLVAVLGPNGAGKTTTLRSITGFLRGERAGVTAGRVELKGTDITRNRPEVTSRRGLVIVPDRRKVFPYLTVQENLRALGIVRSKARTAQLQDQVMEMFPMVAERLSTRVADLSGGQQQMVAIARALMCDPEVLLLDEMTLGLHVSVRPMLFQALQHIAATGRGVLVVDESVDLALAHADHVYVLAHGTVAASGPPGEVRDVAIAAYVGADELR